MNPYALLFILFTLLGVLFLGAGMIVLWIFKAREKGACETVSGTVVDIVRIRTLSTSRQRSGSFYPVYEYYANGEMRRVRSNLGSSPCPFQVGEEVELRFNPDKPEKIFVKKELRIMHILTGVLCILGGLFIIAGIAVALLGGPLQ